MKIFELFTAFFCLISKTNLSIMSIKPSVVCIKGVHSITGPDKTSDIGFPQLELEKLFDGAMIVETADTTYDSSKQYIYYDSNSQTVIQDESHFNCIKNGYYSIANGINHYYTKNGNNYNYNAVPDTSTWAGKWSFSNTITGKNLYSINSEIGQIFIDGDGYYKKENNDYVKQTVKTYDLYEYSNSLNPISLANNNKYTSDLDADDDGNDIIIWTSSSNINISAIDGYYLSIDDVQDTNGNKTYNVKLCYLTFDANGVATSGDPKGFLYKLDISSLDTSIDYYIKNGNNLVKLEPDTSITFATNPADSEILYVYQKLGSYTYPNTIAPETASLYTDSGSSVYKDFNIDNFPLYTIATVTEISKTQHNSYTIYEKSAVKINYNYSIDANSLKFVFTDKTISEVLNACGFLNNIGLEKYVHLTNLEYKKN